ncbi:hypothetical protein [Enteractinococcus coprophilus]|uniref:Uncharacterized protein n=1 Tax=Enteractinococcus coprophilus TaxID=1027633 RepID=A0A543ANU1_9MICC|nr:hypothetical protein [Enteractinococcus coprophilus]TQL74238.1 hypothetical protein FB556_0695 [Enteractinococcus coprophilus]
MADKKPMFRTVSYYQLVKTPNNTKIQPDIDWNSVFRAMGRKLHTYRIFETQIHGRAYTLDIKRDWERFLEPSEVSDLQQTWHDETLFILALSKDKDFVPNQRSKDGDLSPMAYDEDGHPATVTFIWFIPFGNIFGMIMEDNTAIRPKYVASWLNRLMRDKDELPQPNLQFEAAAVLDEETRNTLRSASKLGSVRIGGAVRGTDSSVWRELLGGGPQLEGSFDVTIKIKPIKKGSRDQWEADTERLYDWFGSTFVSDDKLTNLSSAKIKYTKDDEQPDLPTSEIDLFQHRITRKRRVDLSHKNGVLTSISAVNAGREIIESYILDFEELRKHR